MMKKHSEPTQGPRVLITRPAEDAARLTTLLKPRGMEVLVEPLMRIQPEAGAKPILQSALKEQPRAILITSANGVRALAAAVVERNVPLLAVGETSALEAARLGFTDVTAAEGNAKALAALVKRSIKTTEGTLLHVAGSEVAGDLKGELEQAGYAVRRVVAYRAEAASGFSEVLKAALVNCELDMATFFSPRTLKIFDRLIEVSSQQYLLKHVDLVVLSEEIQSAHAWRSRAVAAAPTNEAVADLLAQMQSGMLRR
jgi:uroporphyrinogen-III synthase